MAVDPKLEQIVQRMIDADEPEDNIALVIREYKPMIPSDSGALALRTAGAAIPLATKAVEEIATNPSMRSAGSILGQLVGGAAGLKTMNPLNVAGGVWAGGRAGWHTGKLLQRIASPVASIAGRLAPYAQALNTASGASGIGDLAQMAEPNRRDIGFMGIGPSVDIPGAQEPIINRIIGYLRGR